MKKYLLLLIILFLMVPGVSSAINVGKILGGAVHNPPVTASACTGQPFGLGPAGKGQVGTLTSARGMIADASTGIGYLFGAAPGSLCGVSKFTLSDLNEIDVLTGFCSGAVQGTMIKGLFNSDKSKLFAFHSGTTQTLIYRFDIASFTQDATLDLGALGTCSGSGDLQASVAIGNTGLYTCPGGGVIRLVAVNLATFSEGGHVTLDADGTSSYTEYAADATNAYFSGMGLLNVAKVTTTPSVASTLSLSIDITSGGEREIGQDSTYVYWTGSGSSPAVIRVAKSTWTEVSSLNVASFGNPIDGVVYNGFLYIGNDCSGSTCRVTKINTSTFTVTSTVVIGSSSTFPTTGIFADTVNGILYVAYADGEVAQVCP